ncbi:MAG: TonB-dependent receptor, partial [Gemmatimonadaceae bacterium]
SLGRCRWLVAAVVGVALSAPISALHAQTGKLSGTVTDAETGKPVAGVSVIIDGTTLGSLTGENGKYFIIQVPPGVINVQARRLGYQSVRQQGVQIVIDQNVTADFKIKATNQQLEAITIQAAQTPLILRGQTGTTSVISAEEITSLPVTSIAGVLALQQGFAEVPNNTSVVSLAEEQRSTTSPTRVRGSRGGSSITLIDGVPINNPLFGTNSIDLNTFAVSQINFQRGGAGAEYGNGLSGVINQAVREGGATVSGSVSFQNSTLPGALFNSTYDKLLGQNILNGYLSGPVPGTSAKIRYAVSGQVQSQAQQVLKYDDDVYTVTGNGRLAFGNNLAPSPRDLTKGWQALGGTQNTSGVAKITFLPFADTKIGLSGIYSEREANKYARTNYYQFRGDPLKLVNNRADSLQILTDGGNRLSQDLIKPSQHDKGSLISAVINQRFSRSSVNLAVGQLDFKNTTCPYFLGTCLPSPFFRPNFDQGYLSPSPGVAGGDRIPDAGCYNCSYGGETFTTRSIRGDIQSQVTDHNYMQIGGSFIQHDIRFRQIDAFGQNSGIQPLTTQVYRAKPIEAGAYAQSTIEYDFIKVTLGGRFDYGVAKGSSFTDPFNPDNGTDARNVCEGTVVKGQKLVNASGQPYGLSGCTGSAVDKVTQRPVLLDSAAAIAQLDDFTEAKARSSFSPRISVNFPLTEGSGVFLNAGRYTKVPNYGDSYRNTGVGTIAGTADGYCAATKRKPGTNECVPDLSTNNPTWIGNTSLLLEEAKAYEVGYQTEFGGGLYALQVAVYNRSETGLSGIRQSRSTQDLGSTYDGSLPTYTVIVNGDFQTSRGMEIQLRRRLQNRWGYDINYSLSHATTNAASPDRTNEIQRDESNRLQIYESLDSQDVPNNLNVSLFTAIVNDIPTLPLNAGRFLRNVRVTATYQYRTGDPYTPVRATTLGNVGTTANAAEVNSGRQPNVQTIALQINKSFRLANVAYRGFLNVNNLLDRKNCTQVFANNGTCDSGLRDFNNRRIGNTGDGNTSTSFDQPEYIGARRSISTGITVTF